MIASLVGTLVLAANAGASPVVPEGRWTLQEDSGLCILERQDAEPSKVLSIATTAGSDAYRVAMTVDSVSKVASFVQASLTFSPSKTELHGRASIVKLPDGRKLVWMEGVSPALLDDLSSADEVTIATKSGVHGSTPVADTGKAVEALRRCSVNRLVSWGADAGQFAPGGTLPVPLKARDAWLSNQDLRAVAARSKLSDIDTAFRVAVSQAGIIDGCLSVDAGVEKGVEQVACAAVMNRALFTPARDASGRPVRGVATFRVHLVTRVVTGVTTLG